MITRESLIAYYNQAPIVEAIRIWEEELQKDSAKLEASDIWNKSLFKHIIELNDQGKTLPEIVDILNSEVE